MSCTTAEAPLLERKAPPGYEPFCFPHRFEFVGKTSEITPDSLRLLPVLFDNWMRQSEWFALAVESDSDQKDDLALADRRARSVVAELGRMGVRKDRVQVEILGDRGGAEGAPRKTRPSSGAAWLSAMIPPEKVERLRLNFEETGSVVC